MLHICRERAPDAARLRFISHKNFHLVKTAFPTCWSDWWCLNPRLRKSLRSRRSPMPPGQNPPRGSCSGHCSSRSGLLGPGGNWKVGIDFFFRFFTSSRRDFSMFWSSLAVSLVGNTLDFILQQQRSVPKRILRHGVNYFDCFRTEQAPR